MTIIILITMNIAIMTVAVVIVTNLFENSIIFLNLKRSLSFASQNHYPLDNSRRQQFQLGPHVLITVVIRYPPNM